MTTTAVAMLTPVSALVTTIEKLPVALAGAVHVIDVVEITVTEEQVVPPMATVAPAANKVPVMVRLSPPEIPWVCETGETNVTVGGIATARFHENSKAQVPNVISVLNNGRALLHPPYVTTTAVATLTPVSALVTTTEKLPAALAGAVQEMEVRETTVTEVQAVPPTVTVAPAVNNVPVIVRESPPTRPCVCETGETCVTVGGTVATVGIHYKSQAHDHHCNVLSSQCKLTAQKYPSIRLPYVTTMAVATLKPVSALVTTTG